MPDQRNPRCSTPSKDQGVLDYDNGATTDHTTMGNIKDWSYPPAGSYNHSLPIDGIPQPSIGFVPPDSIDAITEPGYPAYNQPLTQPGSLYDGGTLVSLQTRQLCQKHCLTARRDVNHQSERFFQLEPVARQYHHQP
jgi:hypothetical protein